MTDIRCRVCGCLYPKSGLPYRCDCGGVFDFADAPTYERQKINNDLPGMWRYRELFDLTEGAPVITLGEGNTPLIWLESHGKRVGLKMESLNPSGSYKDRGSAVLASQMLGRGIEQAVEDSSGNAGASFAAYAARAGIKAKIFVPDSASGPKRRQIEQYGAELVAVPGPRSAAAEAVLQAVEGGMPYASHAYAPFGLAGIATIAYEIHEQCGNIGSIIAPVGHGGLLLGVWRGLKAMFNAGEIDHIPYIVGVQAARCSPVVSARDGLNDLEHYVDGGATVAEGVRVTRPVRGEALLSEISSSDGEFLAVPEERIMPAYEYLCRQGVYVEPTSALVWAAYEMLCEKLPEPIILILTGTGLKYNPA